MNSVMLADVEPNLQDGLKRPDDRDIVAEPAAVAITYRFHLPVGRQEIALRFDPSTFQLSTDDTMPAPAWTMLAFNQCTHCPLTPEDTPICPFARGLSGVIERFEAFHSYDVADIEIVTASRTVVATRPLQHGMASLVGLIGATSGCPHLAPFRPMARFHLPFARDDETLYRVFSMYLLGCYLADGELPTGPRALDGLIAFNQAATVVNRGMADRMRAAFSKDVGVNAVVILDMFAQAVPYVIDDELEELRAMFCVAGNASA